MSYVCMCVKREGEKESKKRGERKEERERIKKSRVSSLLCNLWKKVKSAIHISNNNHTREMREERGREERGRERHRAHRVSLHRSPSSNTLLKMGSGWLHVCTGDHSVWERERQRQRARERGGDCAHVQREKKEKSVRILSLLALPLRTVRLQNFRNFRRHTALSPLCTRATNIQREREIEREKQTKEKKSVCLVLAFIAPTSLSPFLSPSCAMHTMMHCKVLIVSHCSVRQLSPKGLTYLSFRSKTFSMCSLSPSRFFSLVRRFFFCSLSRFASARSASSLSLGPPLILSFSSTCSHCSERPRSL